MSEMIATAKAKIEGELHIGYLLPGVLAMNTAALFALDSARAIPQWVKVAASLFLQF